jgi:TP901 family phage tail tape measure protein
MIKFSTDEASKFQTATAEINTLIGLSPELMTEFSDDILTYGSTSTQTFEQINQALYDSISAGVAYEDALDAVRTAEIMAVAGKASLGEAVTLLIPTLNAYGAETDEAARFSDIFFTTVARGVTTIPELSAAMGGLAPTAAAVGVPIETLGAALATLTFNGIGTSEAATGLKAALANIIVPSGEAAKAAEELGVSFGVTALETHGLEGLLLELDTATGGNVDQMARFFGSTEALNAVLALTSGNAEVFTANLKAMDEAAGSVQAGEPCSVWKRVGKPRVAQMRLL